MDTRDLSSLDPHPLSAWVARSGNRNRDSLLEALRVYLPGSGRVLEVGSGRGMHINYFAPAFPELEFQPSDRTDECFAHIEAETRAQGHENVNSPIVIDLLDAATWQSSCGHFRAMFCVNVIHVAAREAVEGLARCAASSLQGDGTLIIFGAFTVDGQYTNERSRALDNAFRAQGAGEWGYRDTSEVIAACQRHGLVHRDLTEMPEGRILLGFTRPQESSD